MEEMIIKREEKLNIFGDRLNSLEELIKIKTKQIKENEIYSKELVKIIEEQKEEIRELEKNNLNTDNIINDTKDNNKDKLDSLSIKENQKSNMKNLWIMIYTKMIILRN